MLSWMTDSNIILFFSSLRTFRLHFKEVLDVHPDAEASGSRTSKDLVTTDVGSDEVEKTSDIQVKLTAALTKIENLESRHEVVTENMELEVTLQAKRLKAQEIR